MWRPCLQVFDVTELGRQYYGKGAGYQVFSGKDSTRALSIGSLTKEDIDNTDLSDFTPHQLKQVLEQHSFYVGKYPRVGRIAGYSPITTETVEAREAALKTADAAVAATPVAAAASSSAGGESDASPPEEAAAA